MSTDPSSSEADDLSHLKLADLKARCKAQQLPVSGTKAELIARLQGTAPPAKKARSSTTKSTKKNAVVTRLDKPVFQSFLSSTERDPIVIKRNAYGHFEHLDTHLIFSAQKKVIGIQVENHPEPQPLTTKDLEAVHKYHFELDAGVVIRDPVNVAGAGDAASTQARLEELYKELGPDATPEESPKLYRQPAVLNLNEEQ